MTKVESQRAATPVPRATYRLQFNRDFTLRAATKLVPYLHALGISHIYASPLLKACPGSRHGYDVCDCSQLNPEVGTEADLESLVAALRARAMGLILDIVPNHMATSPDNPWWWDVLQHGQGSRYAGHFDIEWNSPDPQLRGKVLMPVLGDELDAVLQRNELRVQLENGKPVLCYYEHRFPLAPDSFAGLPAEVNDWSNHSHSLSDLLAKQHYQLAFWRHGDTQINYRRFFNISSLIGVRVEDPQVFADTHERIFDWYRRGWLDGLRIDHPDGLRDPQAYLERLRQAVPNAWIIVEKILAADETLPSDWPVDGTTGYDFLNRCGGLWVDAQAETTLTGFYGQFTGEPTDYSGLVRTQKRWALEHLLRAEVDQLVCRLAAIVKRKSPELGFNEEEWRVALCALIACLPVYRTYVQADDAKTVFKGLSPREHQWLKAAEKYALKLGSPLRPEILSVLLDLLQSRPASEDEAEFIMRFQQLTGPAMAKGVEDTSFYCFNRFVALNEVGGDPGKFGLEPAAFHEISKVTGIRWPDTMLASSTHDTKRSEDVRARLAVLSEIPSEWIAAVQRWSVMNARHRRGTFPDRNAEYLFYQTLVGAWPLSVERAIAYMEKAAREAKQHTHWTDINAAYEDALRHFVCAAMADRSFVAEVERLVSRLATAGLVNSLAQTLIKLTAPGVPDVYQGAELWDFSLVDPDNRRPVDFALRQHLLAEIQELSAEAVWDRRNEGLPKLWLIQKTLQFRQRQEDVFRADHHYRPLFARGDKANHVVAFSRSNQLITVVPRLTLGLANEWADTVLLLPPGGWQNVFSGESVDGGECRLDNLFVRFPVALLARTG